MSNVASNGSKLVSDIYNNIVTPGYTNLGTVAEYFSNYLLDETDTLHIPIRGTQGWKDIKTDADLDLVKIPGGQVHHGAYKQYQELKDDFIRLAKVYRRKYIQSSNFKYKINIYGHSMGTWLSILLLEDLYWMFPVNSEINLFLYAPPNFCDVDYRDYLLNLLSKNINIKKFSYASSGDVIPRFPIGLHQIAHVNMLDFPDVDILDELGHHSIDNITNALIKLGL